MILFYQSLETLQFILGLFIVLDSASLIYALFIVWALLILGTTWLLINKRTSKQSNFIVNFLLVICIFF